MATKIPESYIDMVRSKTNIVDLIGQTVQLHKAGKNLFGLCPFHEERTPSFSVNEEKQIFHCFSCHRGGNVFKFLMELEQISFPEAVIKVAEFSDLPLPENVVAANQQSQHSETRQLQKLYQDAQVLYSHILTKTQVGEDALNYLHQREMDDAAIAEFGLGYAPQQANVLLDFLTSRQVPRELLVRSGLFAQREDGTLIDRFRGRVMFPIQDQNGNVIAFSGRILVQKEHEPKYLNSPETKIFQKRDTLYHFAQARPIMRQAQTAILFEGFMDVITAFRAGVKNGVASMGTSLTSQQLYLLSRAAKKLIICYDGDEPGQHASAAALQLLRNSDFEVGVVSLPERKDPDEFVKKYGASAFQKQLQDHVQTPIQFTLAQLANKYNLNQDADRLAYVQAALQEIVKLPSVIEQDLYLKQVASQGNVDLAALHQEFEGITRQFHRQQRAQQRQNRDVTAPTAQQPPTPVLSTKLDGAAISERRLLYLAIRQDSLLARLSADEDFHFNNEQIQELFEAWRDYARSPGEHTLAAFVDLITPDLQSLLLEIEMMEVPEDVSDEEIGDYQRNVAQAQIRQALTAAQKNVQHATEVGDSEAEMIWLDQVLTLKRQLI
ncbi:DNA primase [Lapidilactobacillus luobeiensis]|uniref:DNA primase n=1 Tax=Lapidilactobacillus luobeiensis TaxID=2950371 RepID=UPI0021C3D8D6|nr:DNA primase [Lapidilactobacillus luobeiensis]